ncbi:transglutaminase family protein [Alkalicoccobacillus gibsonii]|uniref:Transglutaminase family protein n=1 Tax=Alkalicoccobacillus gibsonii TaxID=79881 RepID=A0ABU9VNE0_9BACI
MKCEANDLNQYRCELPEVNFTHPLIQEKSIELFDGALTELEKIEHAFTFVRDDIAHSWDIKSERVTCEASEVLLHKEGICYAKSNLLAALLRSQGIPTGFCYQCLILFNTPADGYCIHALNAVYVKSINRWIRLDARGNKEGIDAQFEIEEEKLAFCVNVALDEKDYPMIYSKPHPKTLAVLREHTNALDMYRRHLPESL